MAPRVTGRWFQTGRLYQTSPGTTTPTPTLDGELPPTWQDAGSPTTADPNARSYSGIDIVTYLRSGGQYGVPGAEAPDADLELLLYSPYGSTHYSAIFPSWLPSSMPIRDLVDVPYQMSAIEVMQVQAQLWAAGYYGEEAIESDTRPMWGVVDAETAGAWEYFVSDLARHGGTGVTGDELLTHRSNAFAGIHRAADVARRSIGDVTIHPTDPAEIEANAQNIARDRLGRRLSQGEVSAVVGVVTSQEMGQLMSNAQAQRSSLLAQAGFNADGSDPRRQPVVPTVLQAGGPDSTAQMFTGQLASLFGLSRSRVSEDGLEVTFGGDDQRLATLRQYLSDHQGVGYFVEGFSEREGNLHLRLREGAAIPDFARLVAQPDREQEVRAFIETMRAVDHPLGYTTDPGEHGTGMFQIPERQMRAVARSRGWDQRDIFSPQAQEAIARAYAEDLYREFGDWRLVAIGFRSSPTVARQWAHRFSAKGKASRGSGVTAAVGPHPVEGRAPAQRPGLFEELVPAWARTIETAMAKNMRRAPDAGAIPMALDDFMQGAFTGGVAGGNVIVAPQVNTSARTELQLDATHGNEMGAFHIAKMWDELMATMQTQADVGAVVDNPGSL